MDPVETPHLQVHTLASQRGDVMFLKSVLEVCVTGHEARGNYSCTATNGQDMLDQEVFHIDVDGELGASFLPQGGVPRG